MRGNDYSRVAVAIICSHTQVPEKQHNHQHHEEGGSEPPQLVERGRIAFVESDEGLRGLEGVPLIEKSVTPLYELRPVHETPGACAKAATTGLRWLSILL